MAFEVRFFEVEPTNPATNNFRAHVAIYEGDNHGFARIEPPVWLDDSTIEYASNNVNIELIKRATTLSGTLLSLEIHEGEFLREENDRRMSDYERVEHTIRDVLDVAGAAATNPTFKELITDGNL